MSDEASNENRSFENPTILKEFSNIVNAVSEEEFIGMLPVGKKLKKINWTEWYNAFNKSTHENIKQEMNEMWIENDMATKLKILKELKVKYKDNTLSWRPQLREVNAQLKSHDVRALLVHKRVLETIAEEYESRVDELKSSVTAKREQIQSVSLDIKKYEKKNECLVKKLQERLENHGALMGTSATDAINTIECTQWSSKDLELNNNEDNVSAEKN